MAASREAMEQLEELTCPVCLDVPQNCKIFQCQNGHLICERCYEQVTNCPICRTGLQKPGPRCLYAEKAIQKLSQSLQKPGPIQNVPLRCKYNPQGCSYRALSASERKVHEEECLSRPLKCPECGLESSFGLLLDHLLTEHGGIDCESGDDGSVRCDFTVSNNANSTSIYVLHFGDDVLIAFVVKKPAGLGLVRLFHYGKGTVGVLVTAVGPGGVTSARVSAPELDGGVASQGVHIDFSHIGHTQKRLSLSFALMAGQADLAHVDFAQCGRDIERSTGIHCQMPSRGLAARKVNKGTM